MTKVYLVESYGYDDHTIEAIFYSQERAEAFEAEKRKKMTSIYWYTYEMEIQDSDPDLESK